MSEERVSIKVNDQVTLEGGFTPGEAGKGGALILHPHPLYGGSMDNNVVTAMGKAVNQAGIAALRINFRGVGRSTGVHSDGVGERDDTEATAAWLKERVQGPFLLTGYSFGALVGSHSAGRIANITAGIWVAPPLILGPMPPWPQYAGQLLVVAGKRDEFTIWGDLEAYMAEMGARGVFRPHESVDHFWWGEESALMGDITEFLAQLHM